MLDNLKSQRWTKADEQKLLDLHEKYRMYNEIPIAIIQAAFPNRSVGGIRSKLKRILAKLPTKYDFSHLDREDITEVLKVYLSGKSFKEIQEEFEIDSLEETEQLCDFVTKELRRSIAAYAEEHNIAIKSITLPKMQEFIKLHRKTDQFSKAALKRVLNG